MNNNSGTVSGWDLLMCWTGAAMFLFAAVWGSNPDWGANPLPGIRRVAADLAAAWPLAIFSVGVAVYVSLPRWRSREGLIFLSGAIAVCWFVTATYVSPGPAIGFAFLAGNLYRQNKESQEINHS